MTKQKTIENFWKWFISISDNLTSVNRNSDLIIELDRRVRLLGNYEWEIGSSSSKEMYFALSTGRNKELLEEVRKIISTAPEIEQFELKYYKPPKEWRAIWKMDDREGSEIIINAENWRYILYGYDDNTFDIMVEAPNLEHLDEDTQHLALEFVIESMIGEESFIFLIEEIEMTSKFNNEESQRASKIQVLKKHFESLT